MYERFYQTLSACLLSIGLTSCVNYEPIRTNYYSPFSQRSTMPTTGKSKENTETILQEENNSSLLDHERELLNYDPVTIEERFDATGREVEPFDKLYAGLKENIKKIYFIPLESILRESVEGLKTEAHAHVDGTGIMCLTRNYKLYQIAHEAGHLRHQALDSRKSDFSRKWERIAGIRYGSLTTMMIKEGEKAPVWLDGTDGPINGCLRAYGSTSLKEDVGTFLESLGDERSAEEIYELIVQTLFKEESLEDVIKKMLEENPYSSFIYVVDPADQRYQQKIDLLREYDFISQEQHTELIKKLGCFKDPIKIKKYIEKTKKSENEITSIPSEPTPTPVPGLPRSKQTNIAYSLLISGALTSLFYFLLTRKNKK